LFSFDSQQYLMGYLPVVMLTLNAKYGVLPINNITLAPTPSRRRMSKDHGTEQEGHSLGGPTLSFPRAESRIGSGACWTPAFAG
jgi:hypothetical protein